MGMQTRLNFHALRKAVESCLVCPSSRDAIEHLASFVPKQQGPVVEHLECILFVDKTVWRFRNCSDAQKISDLIETYFRNFDPDYRINNLERLEEAPVAVRSA